MNWVEVGLVDNHIPTPCCGLQGTLLVAVGLRWWLCNLGFCTEKRRWENVGGEWSKANRGTNYFFEKPLFWWGFMIFMAVFWEEAGRILEMDYEDWSINEMRKEEGTEKTYVVTIWPAQRWTGRAPVGVIANLINYLDLCWIVFVRSCWDMFVESNVQLIFWIITSQIAYGPLKNKGAGTMEAPWRGAFLLWNLNNCVCLYCRCFFSSWDIIFKLLASLKWWYLSVHLRLYTCTNTWHPKPVKKTNYLNRGEPSGSKKEIQREWGASVEGLWGDLVGTYPLVN